MSVSRFLLATLSALLCQALAATVVISPVTLDINPQRQTSTLTTLVNQGTTPLEFTATLVRWTQQAGQEVDSPTRDAAVNPAHFTIQPGHTQVVRIGLRGRSSAPEVTYRLLLRQEGTAAKPTAAGTDQVQAAITPTYVFSLPLFITQPGTNAAVAAHLERSGGTLTLVLSNTGASHAVYRNMNATLNGTEVNLGSVYVLAGSTMRVPLPALPDGLRTLVIHSTDTTQMDHTETLDVPAP